MSHWRSPLVLAMENFRTVTIFAESEKKSYSNSKVYQDLSLQPSTAEIVLNLPLTHM